MIFLFEFIDNYIDLALKVKIPDKGQTFLLKKQMNNGIFFSSFI